MFIGTVNEDFAIESVPGRRLPARHPSVADRAGRPTASCGCATRPAGTPRSRSGWARRRAAPTSCPRRSRGCGARWRNGSTPAGARPRSRIVQEVSGVDAVAAALVVDYLAAGRAELGGVLPTHDDIVFERFFDETGGMQLIVHAPLGARVNRALGLGLRKKFCLNFDFELQAAASNDAVAAVARPPALVSARGRARLPSLAQRAGRRLPGGAPQPDVHRPLAVEPQPVARRAAPQGRPAQPVQHPADGGGRPDGRRVPGPRRLPGQRSRRSRSRSPITRSCGRRWATASTRPWTSRASRRCVRRFEEGTGSPPLRRHRRAQRAGPRDPQRRPVHLPRRGHRDRRAPVARGAAAPGPAGGASRAGPARPGRDRAGAGRGDAGGARRRRAPRRAPVARRRPAAARVGRAFRNPGRGRAGAFEVHGPGSRRPVGGDRAPGRGRGSLPRRPVRARSPAAARPGRLCSTRRPPTRRR